MKPTPDWEKTKVILVNPILWKYYQTVPHDIRSTYRKLTEVLFALGVEYTVLGEEAEPLDIWIRDWGFVEGRYFEYKPSYAKNLYGQGAVRKARNGIDRHLKDPAIYPCTIPELILDGGNIIHNGHTAILTDQVVKDNKEKWTKKDIIRTIENMGFKKVLIIPAEPNDPLGHADGICKFLSENVLLINDYENNPRDCPPALVEYSRDLWGFFHDELPGTTLVRFPWYDTGCRIQERVGSQGVTETDALWAAEGCYLNFIQLKQGIIIPEFNNRAMDGKAYYALKDLGAPVMASVWANSLSHLGGVLNCIVCTY